MRSFAFLGLGLQCLVCSGFSPVKTAPRHDVSNPSRSALCATNDDRGVDFQRKVAGIAATLALGWAVGASSSIAAPALINDWTPASSGASSSVVVSFSDSDFADFSLPSYKEVSSAAINTNLKGGNQLFGEEALSAAVR